MDNINLKDILDGKLTKLPFKLEINEQHDFVRALADALATRQKDFPGIGKLVTPETVDLSLDWKGWSVITDNFILFLMNKDNEFSPELIIAAFLQALRVHEVMFDHETETFTMFFKQMHIWIVADSPYMDKGVYVGDGRWNKNWKPPTEQNKIGGHFTLRDHHKVNKDQ